jgi:hypothetical protein
MLKKIIFLIIIIFLHCHQTLSWPIPDSGRSKYLSSNSEEIFQVLFYDTAEDEREIEINVYGDEIIRFKLVDDLEKESEADFEIELINESDWEKLSISDGIVQIGFEKIRYETMERDVEFVKFKNIARGWNKTLPEDHPKNSIVSLICNWRNNIFAKDRTWYTENNRGEFPEKAILIHKDSGIYILDATKIQNEFTEAMWIDFYENTSNGVLRGEIKDVAMQSGKLFVLQNDALSLINFKNEQSYEYCISSEENSLGEKAGTSNLESRNSSYQFGYKIKTENKKIIGSYGYDIDILTINDVNYIAIGTNKVLNILKIDGTSRDIFYENFATEGKKWQKNGKSKICISIVKETFFSLVAKKTKI